MVELADFKQVAADFQSVADFVTIYISEVHAYDEWDYLGNKYKIKQHASLQERLLAASILLEDERLRPPGLFLVNSMKKEAEILYGDMPERLYIVLDGVIVYAGRKGPFGYKVSEVREWLEHFKVKSH